MSRGRFSAETKAQAVADYQLDRTSTVQEIAARYGTSVDSLERWVKDAHGALDRRGMSKAEPHENMRWLMERVTELHTEVPELRRDVMEMLGKLSDNTTQVLSRLIELDSQVVRLLQLSAETEKGRGAEAPRP